MENKLKIVCVSCKQTFDATLGDFNVAGDQTAVVKCPCGGVTTVTIRTSSKDAGQVQAMLGAVGDVQERISKLIQEYRESKVSGADHGLGDALSLAARDMAARALRSDKQLNKALKDWVLSTLRAHLLPRPEGDPERA